MDSVRKKKDGSIFKRVNCGAGFCWWTVMVGWKFLVAPLWKSVRDRLTV